MQQLNHSFREGGLTCSFNDLQLAEFIQQKLRSEGKLRTFQLLESKRIVHGYLAQMFTIAQRVS